MKEIIKTKNAPKAIGPFSQAVKSGGLLFVSGQTPFKADGKGIISDNIEDQTRQCLNNIKEILKAADSSLGHVVKTTVFTTNLGQFDRINEVYKEFFTEDLPARVCVEVSRLPGDAKIEIEVIAVI